MAFCFGIRPVYMLAENTNAFMNWLILYAITYSYHKINSIEYILNIIGRCYSGLLKIKNIITYLP